MSDTDTPTGDTGDTGNTGGDETGGTGPGDLGGVSAGDPSTAPAADLTSDRPGRPTATEPATDSRDDAVATRTSDLGGPSAAAAAPGAATTDTAATDAAGPPGARQIAMGRWRRARGPLAAALVVIVVGMVLAALQPGSRRGYLDPESPSKEGSRALVRVAGQRGTPVRVARNSTEAIARLQDTSDPLLVVVRSERLLPHELSALAGAPGDRLLVDPTPDTLTALAPGVQPSGRARDQQLPPGCGLRAATLAGSAEVGERTYTAPAGATRCYLDDGRAGLVRLPVAGRTVTVLGTGTPLTNQRLAEHGNAALMLNLLSARPNVVWLMPDIPPPGSSGDKDPRELLPPAVQLVLVQLVIATILVALWRVRRLGPVVTEPLPVVVRSAEAVEGRARLYRSRRARDRATDALRAGSLERLMPLLGLSRSVIQESVAGDTRRQIEVVSAIAARTGTEPDTIGRALYGPAPEEDAELIRLADYLDQLEERVRGS